VLAAPFRQKRVVVAEEDNVFAHLGSMDEVYPLTNHSPALLIGRVSFAGDDKLHKALRTGEYPEEPLGIKQQKVQPFVQSGGRNPASICCYQKYV